MPLPDLLPIQPFTRPARGAVALPGSKSLTNRALLLAALCDQPVTLTGALFSEDTHLMAEALRKLGFAVTADEAAHTLRVSAQAKGFTVGSAELFVGLAGTAARFLTALCAAAPGGVYHLDGVPQMRKRPMKPLIDALRTLGADIRCTGVEGFFPLEIHARGLRGGAVNIDASESSQLLSALLMVAPLAASPITITLVGGVRWPFVAMTINQMAQFGFAAKLTRQGDAIAVPTGRYAPPPSYAIEPDATASSYFTALPLAVGGTIHVSNLLPPAQGLQGDSQFLTVLQRLGAVVFAARGDVDVTVPPRTKLRGVTQDFSEFSDTFLTLAALAPLLAGPTTITGIAHSRKQETDRVAGMVAELRKLGQDVHEHEDGDGLTITPRALRSGVEIETYGDHRFAMSFGILGCHDLHADGRPWLSIKDPACCAKTFPHFFELLETVRQNSLAP
ncbi:MAG: 3-phosphoshikimate 1-carboxyvinyltransferase [Opitutaceae bacterium]|nr:3-phosphoshikimate 1-carboxyvinyltransferase [Opitutaceae bacterium]